MPEALERQVLVQLERHLVPVVGEGGLAHPLDALQDQLAGRPELPTRLVRGGGLTFCPSSHGWG